jgi:hypothetical protein
LVSKKLQKELFALELLKSEFERVGKLNLSDEKL